MWHERRLADGGSVPVRATASPGRSAALTDRSQAEYTDPRTLIAEGRSSDARRHTGSVEEDSPGVARDALTWGDDGGERHRGPSP